MIKKQLNKISFEMNKQIKEIAKTLPVVPYLIQCSDGALTMQVMKKTRIVKGEEILKKDPDAKVGEKWVTEDGKYLSKTNEFRVMNHEVELRKAYQLKGQLGIDSYASYVIGLNESIVKANEKEETNKIKTDMKKELQQPVPEDFGHLGEDKWVDGGEQAYNQACDEYYKKLNDNLDLVDHVNENS